MNFRTPHSAFFLPLLISFAGCNAPEAFHRAQTAFSKGATLENQEHFADVANQLPNNFIYFDDLYQPVTPVAPEHSADDYYEDAMGAIKTALKNKRQLKKIAVLDNAYAIQALSMWRLERYEEAQAVARQAVPLLEKTENDEIDTRDLAMMRALPGLINVDLSVEALQQIQALAESLAGSEEEAERKAIYQQIKSLFTQYFLSDTDGAPSVNRSLAIIEQSIDKQGRGGAISLYLRNVQLAGINNWGDAFQMVFLSARRLNDSSEESLWILEVREEYKSIVRKHLKLLENALPKGRDNKLYQYWVQLLSRGV
ncbi:MAG: hypothetical protein AAF485_32420 [Chloroflexota bacterium]